VTVTVTVTAYYDSQMETRDLGKEELLKHGAEFDSKL